MFTILVVWTSKLSPLCLNDLWDTCVRCGCEGVLVYEGGAIFKLADLKLNVADNKNVELIMNAVV